MAGSYAQDMAVAARDASRELITLTGQQKAQWLAAVAEALRSRTEEVLAANQQDLEQAESHGLSAAMIDRLTLTSERLVSIAAAVDEIRGLPDPVGEIIEGSIRPNGLNVARVRVPLGVVFFIYESRPNVTIDAAALCFKSGNAVILRGGREAAHTNAALHGLLRDCLVECDLPEAAVQFVDQSDRALVGEFLTLSEFIDVVIPRGGRSLIERVSAEARMPVIRHFDGVCHVYVDAAADQEMAIDIVLNSKCQRPGVCNAAESLLIDERIADEFFPVVAARLQAAGVEIRGCPQCRKLAEGVVPASEADFAAEFLDLILSARIVSGVDAAIEHIARFGSGHTEAIVSGNIGVTRRFASRVDAAAVMINASTRFNDGGELGLGAEIGISTDKFHARGPCGLRELTSYKYIVEGSGQTR